MNLHTIRAWWAAALCVFLLAACNRGDDHTDSPAAVPTLTYQLSLTPTAANVAVGQTVPLTGTLVDSEGHTVASPPITYASDAAGVASVDTAGVVTGVAAGTAHVTASVTAPDGSALSQQATVTVTPPAVTYNLVLANAALNLQYNQPATASVTVLGSDGSDVTAQATGWTWVSSDAAVVTPNAAGASATLTATNSSATASASATVTITAVAPDGSTVTGQIAVTALPHYTYQINLSAPSTIVASDRRMNVTATVLRSDGLDVTSQFSNWNWLLAGSLLGPISLSNGGSSTTLFTTYSNQSAQALADVTANVSLIVTADGPDSTVSAPAASLAFTQVPAYTFVTPATATGYSPSVGVRFQLYHTSDDLPTATDCVALSANLPMSWDLGAGVASLITPPGNYLVQISCTLSGGAVLVGATTVTVH
jgi:uncharacterized protein YjdB